MQLQLSICLPIYLFIYLSICLCLYLSVYLPAWKRSNSARIPEFLNLTASKTQQLCETSAIFQLDNIKNEANLRDFLNVSSWQHQKRRKKTRLPSKMETWVQSWRPRTNVFAIFPRNLSKVLRLPRKVRPGHMRCCALSCRIILANLKIWCRIPCACHTKRHPERPKVLRTH